MSSQPTETESAEARFSQAFERLKAGEPRVLPKGSPVSQNNVAKEAGKDPSALKKARFPALVAAIQAYVELNPVTAQIGQRAKKQRARKSADERLEDMKRQRDQAQSILTSANRRILELAEEVRDLQQTLERYQPSPLGR